MCSISKPLQQVVVRGDSWSSNLKLSPSNDLEGQKTAESFEYCPNFRVICV